MDMDAVAVITNVRSMNEFLTLAREAGFNVKSVLRVRNVTSRVLSEYKLRQLKEMLDKDVRYILFDLPLKPKQSYFVAKETGLEPVDRIEVILKIFLAHAPTQEAKLQIKLASLRYELARAKEKVRLAKLGEQPGFLGLGAYEVDVYYNEIKRRIAKIIEKLSRIRERRRVHRLWRIKRNYRTISITGYTCSGKTTLFNAITDSYERVGEEPFTTLSTKFRLIRIGPWKVYVSDTIGFISDLPPFMIHAFRSTLEEILFSDLVILLVDGSESIEIIKKKFKTSFNTLIELGVIDKPIIIAVNKLDLISNEGKINLLREYFENYSPHVVFISAKNKLNIDNLMSIVERLLGEELAINVKVPYSSSYYRLLSMIKDSGKIMNLMFSPKHVSIEAIIPSTSYELIAKKVKSLNGELTAK